MLFACFPSIEIYLLSFVVCMLSHNKNIFLPLKYIENINKNIFNNFLIAASRSTHPIFSKIAKSCTHTYIRIWKHTCASLVFLAMDTIDDLILYLRSEEENALDI